MPEHKIPPLWQGVQAFIEAWPWFKEAWMKKFVVTGYETFPAEPFEAFIKAYEESKNAISQRGAVEEVREHGRVRADEPGGV